MRPKRKFHIAALRNANRIRHCLGILRKKRGHFGSRFQIIIVAVKAHTIGIFHRLSRLDAEKDVVELMIFPVDVVSVIRDHQTDMMLLGKLDKAGGSLFFLWQTVFLNL